MAKKTRFGPTGSADAYLGFAAKAASSSRPGTKITRMGFVGAAAAYLGFVAKAPAVIQETVAVTGGSGRRRLRTRTYAVDRPYAYAATAFPAGVQARITLGSVTAHGAAFVKVTGVHATSVIGSVHATGAQPMTDEELLTLLLTAA